MGVAEQVCGLTWVHGPGQPMAMPVAKVRVVLAGIIGDPLFFPGLAQSSAASLVLVVGMGNDGLALST